MYWCICIIEWWIYDYLPIIISHLLDFQSGEFGESGYREVLSHTLSVEHSEETRMMKALNFTGEPLPPATRAINSGNSASGARLNLLPIYHCNNVKNYLNERLNQSHFCPFLISKFHEYSVFVRYQLPWKQASKTRMSKSYMHMANPRVIFISSRVPAADVCILCLTSSLKIPLVAI